MSFGDLLLAIFLFVNAVKGLPALQLSREVGCDYKVAFVLLHKLRECLEAEQARHLLGGEGTECETDTAYFGGYGKPANHQENRRDLRLAENRTGKRQWDSDGRHPGRGGGSGFRPAQDRARRRDPCR